MPLTFCSRNYWSYWNHHLMANFWDKSQYYYRREIWIRVLVTLLLLYRPVKNSIAHMTIMIFLLLCFPDGCSQWLHPRKHVVCYFEGKRSVTSLNACLYTHLIYTNVGLNPEAKLDITNGKSSKDFNRQFLSKKGLNPEAKLDIKKFWILAKNPPK